MTSLLVALAVAAVIATSVLGVSLLGIRRRSDAALSVGVLTASLVVFDSLALGVTHLFSRWFIVGLALLQLAVVAFFAVRRGRVTHLPGAIRSGAVEFGRALRGNPFALVLTAVVVLFAGWRVFAAAVVGVQDYDGLSYHMPMVMSWVQDHRIGQRIPLNPFADAYPGNLELHAAWVMAISGSAKFAGLAQAPFALVAWLAVLALGRRCGLPRGWAVAAAGIFMMMPSILSQIGMIYNDLAGAAMFVAGVHLAGRAADHLAGQRSWLPYGFVAGVALGFTAGVKPGFVFGAGAALVLVVFIAWRRSRSWRRALAVLALIAVPIAVLGAPFYLRNIILFHNPLAPFALHAGPINLPGLLDLKATVIGPSTPKEMRHLGPLITPAIWFGYQVDPGFLRVQNNYGVLWPLMMLPALVGWLGLVLWRKRTRYYAVVLLPMAGVFLSHPTPWIFRYTIFIVAPAVVALCLGLRWLVQREHRAGLVTATALCVAVLATVPFVADLYGSARSGHPGITTVKAMTAEQLLREVAAGTPLQIYDQPGVEWVKKLPAGSRIGVVDRSRYFPTPLYGENAQNRVIRMSPSPDDTATEVAKQGIDYLFLIEGDRTATWVLERPEEYPLISRTGGLLAFRVGDGTSADTNK